jgi:hypothetical protein
MDKSFVLHDKDLQQMNEKHFPDTDFELVQ